MRGFLLRVWYKLFHRYRVYKGVGRLYPGLKPGDFIITDDKVVSMYIGQNTYVVMNVKFES